jgi:hypothetical protein
MPCLTLFASSLDDTWGCWLVSSNFFQGCSSSLVMAPNFALLQLLRARMTPLKLLATSPRWCTAFPSCQATRISSGSDSSRSYMIS